MSLFLFAKLILPYPSMNRSSGRASLYWDALPELSTKLIQYNTKSEPSANWHKVRIFVLWWR